MSDDLVKRWDEYVESMGCVMGEIEHMAQQMRDSIECNAAEIAKLQARIDALVEDAERQDKQRADAFARRHMNAPEDPHVYVLCERYGYGAVMDAASRLWARKDSMGAFYIGGCIGIGPRAAIAAAKGE